MATATSKTQMVEETTVTLVMSVDAAMALHALSGHGEDLDSDHPIRKGAHEVFDALDRLFRGGDSQSKLPTLYNSITVIERNAW